MNKDTEMFTIESRDFDTLRNLAETFLETNTCVNKQGNIIETQEYVAAKAIVDRIDLAKEIKEDNIIFSENEVYVLSHVVS